MKICKSVVAVLICLLIAVSAPFAGLIAYASSLDSVKNAVEGVISYKCKAANADSVEELLTVLGSNAGEYTSDWYYIALSQYGVNCKNSAAIAALKSKVRELYSADLSKVKVTDMQRAAFTLLACGEDIRNIEGHNLLADCTYNRAKFKPLDSQGANSAAYALLLLDSDDFSVPDKAENTRDDIIKMILDKELDGGGFALFGSAADIDVTTIVIQALAPYKNRSAVKKVVEKSLSILSERQTADGSYKSFAQKTCAESTAQVILALTANGINPVSDSDFIKNGNSVLDGLLNFRLEGGGFSHFEGDGFNNIATYQSLCALVSYYRFMNGNKFFYDYKSKAEEKTAELDKAIEKRITKDKDAKTASKVKTKTKKYNNKNKKTTSAQSSTELKSTSGSSKVVFSKVVKSKKKTQKETTPKSSEAVQSLTNNASTSDEVKANTASGAKSSVNTTQYVPFVVILLGYPVLAAYKIRRK